jgi:ribosomal protein S15P/S13E
MVGKPKPSTLTPEEKARLEKLVAETPSTLPYAHSLGGAPAQPEDMEKSKGRAVRAMEEQTQAQMDQITEQMAVLLRRARTLKDRIEVSHRVYSSHMGFRPVVGQAYFLYDDLTKNKQILSMLSPEEWSPLPEHLIPCAEVKLLSDHTWDILKTYPKDHK